MSKFIEALKTNNNNLLRKIPKSDFHNHATRGGNIRDFIRDITKLPPKKFYGLTDMQNWYESNIKFLFKGKEGFKNRIRSAFNHARNDGITNLTLSFGIDDIKLFNNNIAEFINIISTIQKETAPNISFVPEISFSREHNIKEAEKLFDKVLEMNYFRSIDLVGDDSESVEHFKGIYERAKRNNFILKAHLGEFGNAKTVIEGIKKLNLDQVQHGISAVDSKEAIMYIKDRNIQLNICPSSNLMLGRIKSYVDHPIKKLFREGVNTTINSDDMLIFDQSVSQEYLKLYNSKCLSANELDSIRKSSLENN